MEYWTILIHQEFIKKPLKLIRIQDKYFQGQEVAWIISRQFKKNKMLTYNVENAKNHLKMKKFSISNNVMIKMIINIVILVQLSILFYNLKMIELRLSDVSIKNAKIHSMRMT